MRGHFMSSSRFARAWDALDARLRDSGPRLVTLLALWLVCTFLAIGGVYIETEGAGAVLGFVWWIILGFVWGRLDYGFHEIRTRRPPLLWAPHVYHPPPVETITDHGDVAELRAVLSPNGGRR